MLQRAPSAEDEANELFMFQCGRDLARDRLSRATQALFKRLTGLWLRVIWHGRLDFRQAGHLPVLCPRAARCHRAGGRFPTTCPACLDRNWNPASWRGCFTGECGTESFWASLQMGSVRPVTLVVQSSGNGVAFKQAVALMEMILHDLEATVQAARARQELACRGPAAAQQEKGDERPQRHPSDARSTKTQTAASGVLVSHRQQIVDQVLDYLHGHYQRSLQLGDVAAALKMNSSYLCTVFSHTQGISFHNYLEDLRLAKAKELLHDPVNRIGEVAGAVGYTSANHFRSVFKAREGVSPTKWRVKPSTTAAGP